MSRLLIRPAIGERELLHGYVARLAELNGQRSVGMLRSPRGGFPRVPGCPWGHGFYPKDIAAAVGGDIDQLSYRALKKIDRHFVMLHGLMISNQMIALSYRRICPICFGRTGMDDWSWSIRLMTVCPSHEIQLVGVCGACGRNTSLERRYSVCCCGQKYADLPILSADSAELVVAKKVEALISERRSLQVSSMLIRLDDESWRLRGSRFPNGKSLSEDRSRVKKLGEALLAERDPVVGFMGDESVEDRSCS